jgi:hypothetical protein
MLRLHYECKQSSQWLKVENKITGMHAKFCERYIQEVNKNVRKLVADSIHSLEITAFYPEIRKTAWMIYNATPNERTGKLSPNQMYGVEEPLYLLYGYGS